MKFRIRGDKDYFQFAPGGFGGRFHAFKIRNYMGVNGRGGDEKEDHLYPVLFQKHGVLFDDLPQVIFPHQSVVVRDRLIRRDQAVFSGEDGKRPTRLSGKLGDRFDS